MKIVNCKKINTAAFTMVEMLIAALLTTVIVTAALKVYNVQQKHLLVQEQISDMQQSVRSSMDELSTKIRLAGYGLPPNFTAPIVAANTNPDTITIIYNDCNVDDIKLTQTMAQPSSDILCAGYSLAGINDGDWLYIYDPTTNTGEYFQTSLVQYSSDNIQHNTDPLSRSYPVGSRIFKISTTKYYIDITTDANHPRLMSQVSNQAAQIYADNITNLQFQYVLSSGAIVDVPPLAAMIREVIIRLNSRTDKADNQFAVNYRTRNLETRVKVRNLGMR